MSYDVTALPFQAHANYGTWSIDFERNPSSQQHKVCTTFLKDVRIFKETVTFIVFEMVYLLSWRRICFIHL